MAPVGALFDMSKLLLVKSGEVLRPPFRDVKTVETWMSSRFAARQAVAWSDREVGLEEVAMPTYAGLGRQPTAHLLECVACYR